MEDLDKEIRLQVRTKSDRPVMNTVDTPEYINLATHFNANKENINQYESIQFTENSTVIDTFEDEALLRGEIKPKVVKKNVSETDAFGGKTVSSVTYSADASISSSKESSKSVSAIPGNQGTVASPDGKAKVLPYQDIPGNFATVDSLNPKIEKQERYIVVPASVAPFYNPIVLFFISIMLVLLIVAEIVGLIYVF